jgi:hypothetical protein
MLAQCTFAAITLWQNLFVQHLGKQRALGLPQPDALYFFCAARLIKLLLLIGCCLSIFSGHFNVRIQLHAPLNPTFVQTVNFTIANHCIRSSTAVYIPVEYIAVSGTIPVE